MDEGHASPPVPTPPGALPPEQPPPAPQSAPAGPAGPPTAPAGPPVLHVGSVLRRTFDTFLAHPVPFLILSIPSALLSIAAVVISQTPTRQSGVPVLLLAAEVVAVVFGLAIIAATMDARSGREVSAGGAVAQATGRAVVAILSAVVELIVFVGFLLVFVTAVGVAAAAGAVAVAVAIGIVGAAVFLYVAIRWALAPAAIVIDRFGPVGALNRSFHVTRGNVLRIIGLFVVVGLITLPFGIGVTFISAGGLGATLLVVLAGAVTLLTTPLAGIAAATAYADLTDRSVVPTTTANAVARQAVISVIVGVAVVGAILSILGARDTADILAHAGVPPQNRGVILAGLDQNTSDHCQPLSPKSTFETTDDIWIGGYFTTAVPKGQTATVELVHDGSVVSSGPLTPDNTAVCYYENDPITSVPPGSYEIHVTLNGERIGSGAFSVQTP